MLAGVTRGLALLGVWGRCDTRTSLVKARTGRLRGHKTLANNKGSCAGRCRG